MTDLGGVRDLGNRDANGRSRGCRRSSRATRASRKSKARRNCEGAIVSLLPLGAGGRDSALLERRPFTAIERGRDQRRAADEL